MELARVTKVGIDLSSEIEVLSYTYSGADPLEVIARVDLGDATNPLSGVGGIYQLLTYIDDVLVTPQAGITVPAAKLQTIMISRPVPLESGDVLSVRVIGQAGDTVVTTISTLRDATPITVGDVTGGGAVPVDHDYGGTDALAYKTSAGSGVDNAQVRIYSSSDYNAGNLGAEFIVASTVTDVNGRWKRVLMLDVADYVVYYFKQSAYGPNTKALTVS